MKIRCQVGPNSYTTLLKVYYYDDKGNVIQTKQSNILGGYEMHYTQYNFSNTIKQETHITTDKNLQPLYTEIYDYTYDHANRLTAVNYRCGKNGENKVTLYTNTYDELGSIDKQLFYNNIISVLYEYDMHDQIVKIQNGRNFTQYLNYTDTRDAIGGPQKPCYNGNVAGMVGVSHTYDALNQLTGFQINNDWYSEKFTYDANGNITRLTRTQYSKKIDDLNIQYNGNQLKSVVDNAGSKNAKMVKEYQDYASSAEFAYDANGNLIKDLDRNITSIEYNLLNLPRKITFNNGNMIENYYSDDGVKHKSVFSTQKTTTSIAKVNGQYQKVTNVSYSTLSRYYIGNKEYTQTDNGAITLTRVHNAIGYVVPNADYSKVVGWYSYAKDYLGNVRRVYKVDVNKKQYAMVQSMTYYPSGLPFDKAKSPDLQPYKYTGKEFVEEHGLDEYDNGARWYYPALARTSTLDPHCESYYDISPYSWCNNNFVNVVDPSGKDIVIKDEAGITTTYCPDQSYTGNSAFTHQTYDQLNKINELTEGTDFMNTLVESEEEYTITSGNPKTGGTQGFNIKNKVLLMGENSATDVLGHELFHAYQDAKGQGGRSIFNEVEAYLFQAYLSNKVSLTGSFINPIDGNNASYSNSLLKLENEGYNRIDFNNVVNGFKEYSRANLDGKYGRFLLRTGNEMRSLIVPFLPLKNSFVVTPR